VIILPYLLKDTTKSELESFSFKPTHSNERCLQICQSSTGAIGSKIYPGALKLCSYLPNGSMENKEALISKDGSTFGNNDGSGSSSILSKVLSELIHKDCLVLELGAGVCALPTLQLSLAERHVIATDLPEMLPLLQLNIESNFPSLPRLASTFPLTWGVESDVTALRSSLTRYPDVIIGADVVYHEHLIDPLLNTLKWLTERNKDDQIGRDPPVVVITYVQRFKRAKKFLKLAKKFFEVTIYSTGYVVDYDVLTWTLPKLVAMSARRKGKGEKEKEQPMIFTPESAEYTKFIDALASLDHKSLCENSAEEKNSSIEMIKRDETSSADTVENGGEKGANVSNSHHHHHIDSDSEDEWVDNEGYKRRMLNTAVSGIIEHTNEINSDQVTFQSMSREEKAQFAASRLDFCLHEQLESFVWIMRRKS
jgi:hypothetical protein